MRYLLLGILCLFATCSGAKGKIHEHGYWDGEESANQHVFDAKLAKALVAFFQAENCQSIADFGCGKGDYVRTFVNNGIPAIGYDGNPITPKLTEGLGFILDLSESHDLGETYDWVLSLEVGEHLPKKYEKTFVENLIRHCETGIVLSWAIKGQGGHGHFNEQNNDYIKAMMDSYGFDNDIEAEMVLRQNSKLRWFKNTVMVFRKR